MKDDKDKNKKNDVKEPFPPDHTPNPPQVMDPNARDENVEQRTSSSAKDKEREKRNSPNETGSTGEKKLGESPMEIDDETTI